MAIERDDDLAMYNLGEYYRYIEYNDKKRVFSIEGEKIEANTILEILKVQ